MKKTNIIIFILAITFICLMVGCSEQIQPTEANNSILEEIAVPYDDSSLFITNPDGSYRPSNMMRQLWYYPNVTPCYVSEDLMYAVFKGNDDTIGDYYGYVFFNIMNHIKIVFNQMKVAIGLSWVGYYEFQSIYLKVISRT